MITQQVTEICLTIGIVLAIACCLTLEVKRDFSWNGTTKASYRIRLF